MSDISSDILASMAGNSLSGEVSVPGDKSISHRALLCGAMASGCTSIRGLLEADDVMRTAAALQSLGIEIERGETECRVFGRGIGGLRSPDDVLDLANSGTGVRLLMGLVSTHPVKAVFHGDASLRRRPMERVAAPLRLFGSKIELRDGGTLPAVIEGSEDTVPIRYRLPVPSAQVKSALLLAALNVAGRTSIIEPSPTRDHTEIMLRQFGMPVEILADKDGSVAISIDGQPELQPRTVSIPGDPSSAAFIAAAAALVPGSQVTIRSVGLNPHRIGFFRTLQDMGGDINIENETEQGGEQIGDITVRHSALHGIDVPPDRAASMIDEFPVLSMIAACASGKTKMSGLSELRLKESDRIATVAKGLRACGVTVEESEDALIVHGGGKPPSGGARIDSSHDHRIAMSFLVLGLACRDPVRVRGAQYIGTSFPDFPKLIETLGGRIGAAADSPEKEN